MGGFTVAIMFAMMGAFALVIMGVLAVALAAFVAATAVSIVFFCRRKKRAEQGKRLKGLLAVPLVLYALSIPVLVWFAVVWVVPYAADVEGDEFADFSQAVASHEPGALQECFDAGAFSFPSEGPNSLASLLEVAISYGDASCAETVLAEAAALGAPLDVNEPLPSYTVDGEPYDAEYALVRAAGRDYSSARMLGVLLEAGADPNAASLLDSGTARPLHLVCDVSWTFGLSGAELERALADAGSAIDLLLAHGADPAAVDAEGRTAGERYVERLGSLVDGGALDRERADRLVAQRAADLGLA